MDDEQETVATSKPKAKADTLKHLTLTGVKLSHKVLGSGASGTVYKAYHNGIPCAAKKVDPVKLRYLHTEGNQYFIQECLRHSQLKHKNIVKMLGVSYTSGHSEELVLVMELMEYTLRNLLLNDEEMFIPMYVKLSILQDVSAGLQYLHTRSPPLAHGDLAPENILLSADLVGKIGDFGNSKVFTHRLHYGTGVDTAVGSPLIFGGSFYDQLPSDVRMFGHLAYIVITQKTYTPPHWRNSESVLSCELALPSPLRSRRRAIIRSISYQNDFAVTMMSKPSVSVSVSVSAYFEPEYIDNITDGPLRHLMQLCLIKNSPIPVIFERIADIKTSK